LNPIRRSHPFSAKSATPASILLDLRFIEPTSFHLDPRLGARSGDMRAQHESAVSSSVFSSVRRPPLSSSESASPASVLRPSQARAAANIIAARTCFVVSVGNARKMSASLAPSAKLAITF
jgi:hypothetical protein